MKKQWGLLAVVLVLAGCGVPVAAPQRPGVASETRTAPPTPRFGDGAPHEQENRGGMQPGAMAEDVEKKLTAKGKKLLPALEKLSKAADLQPESTIAVLVAAGYPKAEISIRPEIVGPGVVYGVPDSGACIVGDVTGNGASARARGEIPEWGCGTPDAH